MKKKILIGSIIAVAIIMFSSFSSVVGKVSSEDELVEFDVEFCGLNKKHTVKLTQQEADEVEELLDNIEKQFENVVSVDEAETIISNAIVQFHKYELLGDLSVKQVQQLIIGNKLRQEIIEGIGERYKNFPFINMNLFCYVVGQLTHSYSFGPIYYMAEMLGIKYWSVNFPFRILGFLMTIVFDFAPILYTFNPVNIFKIVTAGSKHTSLHFPPTTSLSKGLIITFGLLGLKLWVGENLIGSASDKYLHIYLGGPDGEYIYFYPAFIGFSGIRINTIADDYSYLKTFYLGFSIKASFEYK